MCICFTVLTMEFKQLIKDKKILIKNFNKKDTYFTSLNLNQISTKTREEKSQNRRIMLVAISGVTAIKTKAQDKI